MLKGQQKKAIEKLFYKRILKRIFSPFYLETSLPDTWFQSEASLFGRHRRREIWRCRKVPQIGDFYSHWRNRSLMACVVDESHTVETWTGNAGQLRSLARTEAITVIPRLFRDSPQDNSEYFFSRRRFKYTIYLSFCYTFAMLLLHLPGKLNKHC